MADHLYPPRAQVVFWSELPEHGGYANSLNTLCPQALSLISTYAGHRPLRVGEHPAKLQRLLLCILQMYLLGLRKRHEKQLSA